MSEPYRVPKHQVPAEVRLPGKPVSRMKLFLSECAQNHSGVERPSDLLNGPSAFLPVAGPDGRMIFVNRDELLAVSVRSEDEFAGAVEMAVALSSEQAASSQVDVTMEDGSRFRGSVSYLMPEGSRRLQDFLNQGERFLLLRDGDTVRLLNKSRILQILPT